MADHKISAPGSKGFTLIEVLVALAIFSAGLLAVSFMGVTALKSLVASSDHIAAVNSAQSRLEEYRSGIAGLPAPAGRLGSGLDDGETIGKFNRTVTATTFNNPDYTIVGVTVSWGPDAVHQVTLKTILAQ